MTVAYCVATAIIVLAVLFVMFLLARDVNLTHRGLFRDWRDALDAYWTTRSTGERIFLVALQCAYMLRAGMWAFLAATATAMGGVLSALCGLEWAEILREIRLFLRELYYALRSGSGRNPSEGSGAFRFLLPAIGFSELHAAAHSRHSTGLRQPRRSPVAVRRWAPSSLRKSPPIKPGTIQIAIRRLLVRIRASRARNVPGAAGAVRETSRRCTTAAS